MPKYLIQATYTAEGAKGLLTEGGTGRRRAVDEAVASLGGTVEALYFAFGEHDLISIIDLPSPTSMAAISLRVKASGALHTRATPLLTIDDIDAATHTKATFRPPKP